MAVTYLGCVYETHWALLVGVVSFIPDTSEVGTSGLLVVALPDGFEGVPTYAGIPLTRITADNVPGNMPWSWGGYRTTVFYLYNPPASASESIDILYPEESFVGNGFFCAWVFTGVCPTNPIHGAYVSADYQYTPLPYHQWMHSLSMMPLPALGDMALGFYEARNVYQIIPVLTSGWPDAEGTTWMLDSIEEAFNYPLPITDWNMLYLSWVANYNGGTPVVAFHSNFYPAIMSMFVITISPIDKEFTLSDLGHGYDLHVLNYKMMEEIGVGDDEVAIAVDLVTEDSGAGDDNNLGNPGPHIDIVDSPEIPVPYVIPPIDEDYGNTIAGTGHQIAVAPSGRIWVIYRRRVTGFAYVYMYAAYSDDGGITWIEEDLLASGGYSPYGGCIAVDSSGNVHAVYFRTGVGAYPARWQVVYRKRMTSWAAEELVTDYNRTYYPDGLDIAVDSSEDVHISWASDDTPTGWAQCLYKKRTSGVWGALEKLTTETSVNVNCTHIAVDTYVHVLYDHDASSGYTVHYRRKNGGSWGEEETVFNEGGGSNYDTYDGYSMAVGADGDVHAVARKYDIVERYCIAYKRRNGSWGDEYLIWVRVLFGDPEDPEHTHAYSPTVTVDAATGDVLFMCSSEIYDGYPAVKSIIQRTYTDSWQGIVVVQSPQVAEEDFSRPMLAANSKDAIWAEYHDGAIPTDYIWYGGAGAIAAVLPTTHMGVDEVIIALELAPSWGTELVHGADSVFITRGLEHETPPPAGEQFHETMIHPHKSKWYAGFIKPRVIWRGTVLTDRGAETDDPVAHDLVIHIDSGDYGNVGSFDVTDFMPDLTAWVSKMEGDRAHGKCRVRHFEDNGYDLHVACDMACFWHAGDTIEITDRHDLWPKLHRVEPDGIDFEIWMDWDLEDDVKFEYPVPVFGSDRCAFFTTTYDDSDPPVPSYAVTLAFDGSLSFLVQPDSKEYTGPGSLNWDDQGIASWDWWFEGADTPVVSGKQVTATYTNIPPDGHYVVRLTVTDSQDGRTEIGFRDVLLFERTIAPPITTFEIKRFGGSLDSHGWEAEIEVFDTLYDPTVLEDGTKAIIFAEEWYGDYLRADFPDPAFIHGDGNIKLIGWTTQTAMSYDAETFRSVTIAIRGLQSYMESFSNNAAQWSMVDHEEPDWIYFELLTTRKALYHLLKWYWTIYRFTDVTFPDDHNNSVGGAIFPEGSLGKQLDEFVHNVQARWTCDCRSALCIFSWPNWLPVNGAGAEWRNRFHRNTILYNRDVKHVDVTPRVSRDASRVRVEGVVQWDETSFQIVVDTAPGDIRQLAGDVFVLGSQWLGTGGFEHDAYGNESQGYELAKMLYAEQTRPIEKVSLPLNGNYGMFDVVPDAMYFKLTFHPKQVLRDIDWTLKPFWCTGVEYAIDVEAGTVNTTLVALPETWETPGVGVWSQYGPDGKEKDWLPQSGTAKPVRSLRAINTADGRIVPATMMYEYDHPGTVRVRLYNDPAQTVIAECKNYKVIAGRPVHVEINNRRSSSGHPGQQVYTVVGIREAQTDVEDTTFQRGFITRKPTFCINMPFVTTDAAPPLPVLGSPVTVLRIAATAAFAGAATTTFVVRYQFDTLGIVSLGAGVQYAETVLENPRKLFEGYILHLDVIAVGGCENVSITVECREYGL